MLNRQVCELNSVVGWEGGVSRVEKMMFLKMQDGGELYLNVVRGPELRVIPHRGSSRLRQLNMV